MTKKLLFGLVVCAALSTLLVGCKKEEKATKTKAKREYNAMVLQTASRELNSTFSATIKGKQDVDIRTKVEGYITDIKVNEGSIVKKGETLFVIDQSNYEAAYQAAKAKVEVKQALVEAAQLSAAAKEVLFEQNIVSEFDLRMARTNLASARAELAQARADELTASNNLAYTLIKSPVDGVVGTLPFRRGTLVRPSESTPITTVSDNSEMYVCLLLDE